MSAGHEHGQDRGRKPARSEGSRARRRLGPLPRPLAFALLAAWALVSVFALIQLVRGPAPWSGETEGMIPKQDRSARGRPLLMLRVKLEALEPAPSGEPTDPTTDPLTDPATILAEAGFALEEALGDRRVPLAPPRTEITRWLDAHALYLLPIETHAALAERLSDASMLSEVRALEARLSSPLFVVSGEQPRRDPLGIHELATRDAGQLGHVTEVLGSDAPQVSASGDLIAASGDRALIALVVDRSDPAQLTQLYTDVEAALEGLPVEFTLFDPGLQEAALANQLSRDWARVLAACFAALILLLAIAMRRVLPVLALGVCLASAWVLLVWAAVNLELDFGGMGSGMGLGLHGMELASVALSILLLGFGCDVALRLQTIDSRGWIGALIMAGALAPLALSPYPLWQRWALWWAAAYLVLAAILRVILPALLELLRGDFDWRRPGFRLVPMPALAVLICLSVCAAGAWVTPQLRYRSPARVPIIDAELQAHERELVQHFFDPSMVVEAISTGVAADGELETPEAAALEASAATATALAVLVPNEARRLDSPGSFVLPRAELEARKQALSKLMLSQRMESLDVLLTDQRLRAEAFAEFVRGAVDIEDLPSAQAALDGPLGPWINGYLSDDVVDGRDQVQLHTRLELRGRDGLPQVPLSDQRLAELPPLHGPAIAAMIDQREFLRRAGVVVLAGLWLTAFLVWLGTGGLGIALAAALVSLACQAGVMLALSLLDQPTGPHLLPVILIVGAAAGVAGARACKAVSLGQPIVARGLLLAGGCQVLAGGVLLSSAQPLWRELGLAVAIGSALACGLGLFATPGLASLFGKLRGRRAPTKPAAEPPQEREP